MNEDFQRARSEVWLPAVLLIGVQMISGMRDLPQMAFFVIYLQERLGLAPVIISGVVAGAQVVGMLMALVGGSIGGRLNSKWLLALGLTLSGVSSLAFQTRALWPAALLWLVGGAGLALSTVGGASYLSRIGARGALGLLAAFYALSMTAGGALGNPLAGWIIERYGFSAFSWTAMAISGMAVLAAIILMPDLEARAGADHHQPPRNGILAIARQPAARYLVGLRSLPTIFYGMLMVLIPLLLNEQSGSKVMVAAYGTTNLVVASAAQLLAGRSADRWGGRGPSLAAYGLLITSGVGLAITHGTVWGLFVFGVLGIAAAWSLSTLMFVWVNAGVSKAEQPAAFGLLHAVWSLSMITGSVLGGWFVASLPGLPFLLAGLINTGALFLIVGYYRHLRARAREVSTQPVY